jgi:16S rRNA (cytidine1402-2'-O)-methyltransferase
MRAGVVAVVRDLEVLARVPMVERPGIERAQPALGSAARNEAPASDEGDEWRDSDDDRFCCARGLFWGRRRRWRSELSSRHTGRTTRRRCQVPREMFRLCNETWRGSPWSRLLTCAGLAAFDPAFVRIEPACVRNRRPPTRLRYPNRSRPTGELGSAPWFDGAMESPHLPSLGELVIAGVPLGNAGDASARLRSALETADVIAAEDTRRLRRLAADLDVHLGGRIVSYFEANESARTSELVADLEAGRRVLLVTDAGMPSISDPGYRLVVAALAAGVGVTCLPGPSAVTTALALSGLPVDRFCFEGFLPRRSGARAARLRELAAEPRTMVFFEAPHRLGLCLEALALAFGPSRLAAVCRELTKTYEEVRRGSLAELVAWAAAGVRGEITIVVGGAPPVVAGSFDAADLASLVSDAQHAGLSRKEAIAAVASRTGAARRDVFDALVARKKSDGTSDAE